MKRLQLGVAALIVVLLLEVGVGVVVRGLLPWLVGLFVLLAIYGVLFRR